MKAPGTLRVILEIKFCTIQYLAPPSFEFFCKFFVGYNEIGALMPLKWDSWDQMGFFNGTGAGLQREPIIFTGAWDLKGSQKSKIYLILGLDLLFLGQEKVEFLKILGPVWRTDFFKGAPLFSLRPQTGGMVNLIFLDCWDRMVPKIRSKSINFQLQIPKCS